MEEEGIEKTKGVIGVVYMGWEGGDQRGQDVVNIF